MKGTGEKRRELVKRDRVRGVGVEGKRIKGQGL
jgi:hypothetical protein